LSATTLAGDEEFLRALVRHGGRRGARSGDECRHDTTEFSWELAFTICQKRSFWTCPCAHAVFVGLNVAHVSTALCATVSRVPLKVIVRACCVEPYDGVGRAMPERRASAIQRVLFPVHGDQEISSAIAIPRTGAGLCAESRLPVTVRSGY
jgi:hypothetical protein